MPDFNLNRGDIIVDKFLSHAEKEFWEKVYITFLGNHSTEDPAVAADYAVEVRRVRLQGLLKPGVKAA